MDGARGERAGERRRGSRRGRTPARAASSSSPAPRLARLLDPERAPLGELAFLEAIEAGIALSGRRRESAARAGPGSPRRRSSRPATGGAATNRSPGAAAIGAESRSCARAEPPGASSARVEQAHAAPGSSEEKWWKKKRSPDRDARAPRPADARRAVRSVADREGVRASRASGRARELGELDTGEVRADPLARPRLRRLPAVHLERAARARAGASGRSSSFWSREIVPETRLPVTTGPNPAIEKRAVDRKPRRRAPREPASRSGRASARRARRKAVETLARPRGDGHDRRRLSRNEPRTSSRTSSAVTATSSGASAIDLRHGDDAPLESRAGARSRSARASAASPTRPPRRRGARRRSRRRPRACCGRTARGPGTSTKETRTPSHSACANPRSIVMPRRFSSGSRSASIPVRAFTSAVLPWSMWPGRPDEEALHAVERLIAMRRGDSLLPCWRASKQT